LLGGQGECKLRSGHARSLAQQSRLSKDLYATVH
jgi:hypothetical protein